MIQVRLNISREVLENIFVTALEGGSNYWFLLSKSGYEKVKLHTYPSTDSVSIRIFKYIFDHKGTLDVLDSDSEEQIGVLSYYTVHERLQMMIDDNNHSALLLEIEGQGDATTSDNVFQHLCLGEVIYC